MNLASFIRRCDEPLPAGEFGPLDALALCWATYFDYEGVSFPIAAKTLAILPFAQELEERNQTFVPRQTADFMDAFLHSPRYQDVIFLEKEEVRDYAKAIQFFAFTYLVNDRVVIAFEGTDTSTEGWREDFMLTYSDGIGSYRCALEYVEDILSRFEGNVILAGHSKGGNVASYVLAAIEDDSRIEKVYSFEGPGFFRGDVFEKHPSRIDKIEKFIPQCAIVGVLLSPCEKPKIVRSYDFIIYQHNAIEWQIRGNDFVYAKNRTLTSHNIEKTMNGWINGLSVEEKEQFTSMIFGKIDKAGIVDFGSFFANLFSAIPALSKMYAKLDSEEKLFFNRVARALFKQGLVTLFPMMDNKKKGSSPSKKKKAD